MNTDNTFGRLKLFEAHFQEHRRQEIIEAINLLGLAGQMPQGWEGTITTEHVIILPNWTKQAAPELRTYPFIQFYDDHDRECFVRRISR